MIVPFAAICLELTNRSSVARLVANTNIGGLIYRFIKVKLYGKELRREAFYALENHPSRGKLKLCQEINSSPLKTSNVVCRVPVDDRCIVDCVPEDERCWILGWTVTDRRKHIE
jgi:hypothetical protein